MIEYTDIRKVHLELTTNCNAACPMCLRNLGGIEYNAGYPLTQLTLEDIKKIFPPLFIRQLHTIIINGNLGDAMLAKDTLEIIRYLRVYNQKLIIDLHTNGSARTSDFWVELAELNVIVFFGLDGLEDTHSLYRINTNFNLIIKNATTFIEHGGEAVWKFIKFDHNEHQTELCQQLANRLGFEHIEIWDHSRSAGAVYNKDGTLSREIGNTGVCATSTQQITFLESNFSKKEHFKADIKPIVCDAKQSGMIYIAANGEVYPCCYLGFFPLTFSSAVRPGNEQIHSIIKDKKINVLEHPLQDCLEWFKEVELSWHKESFEQGRLYLCNHHCGQS